MRSWNNVRCDQCISVEPYCLIPRTLSNRGRVLLPRSTGIHAANQLVVIPTVSNTKRMEVGRSTSHLAQMLIILALVASYSIRK